MKLRHLPAGTIPVTQNFEQLQKLLTTEKWKLISTLGYKNSWTDFEVGKRLGEYRKDEFGNVELRGVIKGGESGKAVFVLPVGYGPKANVSPSLSTIGF